MSNKPLNISEEAAVQMPMKTVASLIIIVALGTMGYFQIIERLNVADTRIQIMEKDLEENTEFRIKWPRGKPLNISEEAAVQMPMKTVASLIIIVALGTMGYFQIIERLNVADTRIQIMEKDLEENTEFRIKWPRGQLGSLPADSEQYMMIEDLYKTTDKLNKHIESMALNKVNIEFLRKQMDKVLTDIEKLKDANREIGYKNGSYSQ